MHSPMAIAWPVGQETHSPTCCWAMHGAGRGTEPLAHARLLESHQQHNDLCSPLRPGRCKGEPLLSAHDETSVFPLLAEEINFVCAQARGICPLSYFCLYHLNIQYSFYASVLVKVSEEGPPDAQDLMSLAY